MPIYDGIDMRVTCFFLNCFFPVRCVRLHFQRGLLACMGHIDSKTVPDFQGPFSKERIPIISLLRFKAVFHPGRLTWNLQITHLERNMIFQTSMIMFHVNLPGCCIWSISELKKPLKTEPKDFLKMEFPPHKICFLTLENLSIRSRNTMGFFKTIYIYIYIDNAFLFN